jgi:hypothetical protein
MTVKQILNKMMAEARAHDMVVHEIRIGHRSYAELERDAECDPSVCLFKGVIQILTCNGVLRVLP